MHKINRRIQRRALYGWTLFTPLVMMVFAVLFCDAWLNIQTRKTDYELGRLNKQMRVLRSELDSLRGERAEREGIGNLASKAERLGLVEPEPRQVMRISYDKSRFAGEAQGPMTMARLDMASRRSNETTQASVATILLSPPESAGHTAAASGENNAPAFRLVRPATPLDQQEFLSSEGESLLPDVMAAIKQTRADNRPEAELSATAPLEALETVREQQSAADAVLAPLLADLTQELQEEWKLLSASL